MIVKVFKGVWFLSLLATVAIFLYVYASLPADIQLREESAISRDTLFYATLAVLTLFNALIFAMSRLYAGSDDYFQAWFYGLMIFLNLFIIVTLQFLNVYNSQEKYSYDNIGYVIYGSLGMVVLWSSLWPANYLLFRLSGKKSLTKTQN